jgi:hypothetical protein
VADLYLIGGVPHCAEKTFSRIRSNHRLWPPPISLGRERLLWLAASSGTLKWRPVLLFSPTNYVEESSCMRQELLMQVVWLLSSQGYFPFDVEFSDTIISHVASAWRLAAWRPQLSFNAVLGYDTLPFLGSTPGRSTFTMRWSPYHGSMMLAFFKD